MQWDEAIYLVAVTGFMWQLRGLCSSSGIYVAFVTYTSRNSNMYPVIDRHVDPVMASDGGVTVALWAGAAPGGGGGGSCPLWFFFLFLVSSAVSHVHDDNTPTPFWNCCLNCFEAPPPPPLSDFFSAGAAFQGWRSSSKASPPPPKQTPWRRPWLWVNTGLPATLTNFPKFDAFQRCSVENQKGAIAVQSQWW